MPDTNQPPFMPVSFPPGPPTAVKGVWEDGPGLFVNPSNIGAPVHYTGQNQPRVINVVRPPVPPPPLFPGKTWVAAGVDQVSVQNAVNLAQPGDIVQVPAGSATWAGAVNIPVPILLQGAGIGATVISNSSVNSAGQETGIFALNSVGIDQRLEITGFYLQSGPGGSLYHCNGINMNASSILLNSIVIHDCVFDSFSFAIANGQNGNSLGFGVVYRCTFINCRDNFRNAGFTNQAALYGAVIPAPAWGSAKYMVYEGLTIQYGNFGNYPLPAGWTGGPTGVNNMADTEFPMNYLVRYCNFTINRNGSVEVDGFDMHGSGNALAPSSPYANNYGFVIHDNVFTYTGLSVGAKLADIRGGVGALVFNNIIHGQGGNYMQLRTDPTGSIAPAQAYTWNNTQDAGPIADPGVVGPPAGYTEIAYPHPLRVN